MVKDSSLKKQTLTRQRRICYVKARDGFLSRKAKAAVTDREFLAGSARYLRGVQTLVRGGSLTTSPRPARPIVLEARFSFSPWKLTTSLATGGHGLNDLENEPTTDVIRPFYTRCSLCPYAREAWVIHARDPTRHTRGPERRIPARCGGASSYGRVEIN